MAFVVKRPKGGFEIRETRTSAKGPRSRTLATFRVLNDAVLDRAEGKADSAFYRDDVRTSARRAGAEVAPSLPDELAGRLLYEIARGRRPTPGLNELLAQALDHVPEDLALWIAASNEERGDALRDLLAFAETIPTKRRPDRLPYPRLVSRA